MSALKLNELKDIENLEADIAKSASMSQDPSTASTNGQDQDDLREDTILQRNSSSQLSLLELQSPDYIKLKSNLPDVNLKYKFGPVPKDDKKVFFFDIDNCLYQRSYKIHDLMQIYIHRFFKKTLQLNDEEAHELHLRYYKEYGLAIEGLVRHHKINALEYNKVVDDALPLDQILKPNPKLREMLLDLRKSGKVDRLWLFTNAYKNHGIRVIKLLGLGDCFDGLTFCDYAEFPLTCKPMKAMFDKALNEAGVSDPKNAYFIDDSGLNVKAANQLGWGKIIQYVEREEDIPELVGAHDEARNGIHVIRDVLELREVCKELF
ncbi:unnamed protein product [[Candida] boidinii]|nr:hypothetical protein BVG19_g1573 [[Candida] boidinii]OWB50320.1 hydrolase activity protein [[Candida] boidinii]OWB84632.1 hydrolase activity protein [[Candida] boidinii]GMF06498.1 unnamed protein product [[Candida] boidinii]